MTADSDRTSPEAPDRPTLNALCQELLNAWSCRSAATDAHARTGSESTYLKLSATLGACRAAHDRLAAALREAPGMQHVYGIQVFRLGRGDLVRVDRRDKAVGSGTRTTAEGRSS